MNVRPLLLVTLLLMIHESSRALEWIYLTPNPAYTSDLAMGGSTLALNWPPQSQSANPAGFTAFERGNRQLATVYLNPGGAWQVSQWVDQGAEAKRRDESFTIPPRLLVHALAVRWKIATLAGIFGQPVMRINDVSAYRNFEHTWGLAHHQNSVLLALNLHRRIALAGRVDRYYEHADPLGEGYSYGVILRPRGVTVGLQYQRYPASGSRVWHPLDTRRDQSLSAGLAFGERAWRATVQVMNLTTSGDSLGLEPRIGTEYRPWRHLGLRAGTMTYAVNNRWAWTAGLALIDANWFREKLHRLPVPDDILQAAVAVTYEGRTPVLGMGSLTLSWRL